MLQTTTLKLFCVSNDTQAISNSITKAFSPVTANIELSSTQADSRVVVNMVDNTSVTFHISSESSYIADEITNLITFYAQHQPDDAVLYQKIIQQISMFRCISSATFARTDDTDRTDFIVSSIFEIAQTVFGFICLPSGSMRDADGKCFIGPDGSDYDQSFEPIGAVPVANNMEQAPDLQLPHASSALQEPSDTLFASFVPQLQQVKSTPRLEPPQQPSLSNMAAKPIWFNVPAAEDRLRKEKSIRILKARSIPYLDQLDGIVQAQAKQRTVEEIAGRATALLAVSVVGESLCNGDSYIEANHYVNILEERFGAYDYLSLLENAFLENENSTEVERVQMSWRYECCAVMLWALGYSDLPYPNKICDVSEVTKIILNQPNFAALVRDSKPLAFETILDQADLTLRYNWACVDSRYNQKDVPADLDCGVVVERLQALNWLIGAHDRADWDQIGLS